MQKRALNPEFLPLPALPAGYGYVLPYANGVDVNRIIIKNEKNKRTLSIYYDIACACGAMYDVDGRPEAYVELYDGDYAPADYEPIRVMANDIKSFHRTILGWCAYEQT